MLDLNYLSEIYRMSHVVKYEDQESRAIAHLNQENISSAISTLSLITMGINNSTNVDVEKCTGVSSENDEIFQAARIWNTVADKRN